MINIFIVSCFCLMIGSLNADSCPTYSTMANFDPNKASGIWYQFATDSERVNPAATCIKINLNMNKNGTVETDYSAIGLDGSEQKSPQLFTTDDKGNLYTTTPVVDESIFGSTIREEKVKVSIIYTDYTNISAIYTCYESKVNNQQKANPGYTIYVRNRNFDSLKQFGAALQALTQFGFDLDDLRLSNNPPTCKN